MKTYAHNLTDHVSIIVITLGLMTSAVGVERHGERRNKVRLDLVAEGTLILVILAGILFGWKALFGAAALIAGIILLVAGIIGD